MAYGTFQLVVWNRNYDPRFYHFLSTAPGRTLARVMKWPTLYNRPADDKPETEFSPEELSWKRRMEAQVRATWPTHRIVTLDGEEHAGRVLAASDTHLTFLQSFGGQGRVTQEFDRRLLKSVGPYSVPKPEITWRDVRFQMEYPEFHLIHFGTYTVLTDAPFYQVADSIRELEILHQQFTELFAPLLQAPAGQRGLQVLFFNDETQYRGHQSHTAPTLASSAGFYSPLHDRMVVFNQFYSHHSRTMRDEIQAEIDGMLARATNSRERRAILDMKHNVQDQLRERGRRETIATLRHEGAHHLAYTYGVHSWFHAENGWLIEGLAVYFEAREPGAAPESHAMTLRNLVYRQHLPPLANLVRIRKPEDFEAELPGFSGYEVYALSWSLVHFAMHPAHREGFFDYLRYLRNPENLGELVATPRIDLIARHLHLTPEELEQAWLAYIGVL